VLTVGNPVDNPVGNANRSNPESRRNYFLQTSNTVKARVPTLESRHECTRHYFIQNLAVILKTSASYLLSPINESVA
jgi:hypothetical protein